MGEIDIGVKFQVNIRIKYIGPSLVKYVSMDSYNYIMKSEKMRNRMLVAGANIALLKINGAES